MLEMGIVIALMSLMNVPHRGNFVTNFIFKLRNDKEVVKLLQIDRLNG